MASEREQLVLDTVLSNEAGRDALISLFREKQGEFKNSFWAKIAKAQQANSTERETARISGVVEGLEVAIALITSLSKKR